MEVDWNVITGEIMTQILKIVLPVVVGLIIKWAAELYLKIKAERPDLAPIIDFAASTAVYAAEGIYGPGEGQKKLEYAIEAVRAILQEYGLQLDITVISDAIEAAVFENLNRYRDMSTDTGMITMTDVKPEPEE